MMSDERASKKKRWRGVILQLVHKNHEMQEGRYRDGDLWVTMRDLSYDVGLNDVLTLLQDLKSRGYLAFKESKNDFTNRVEITNIEITSGGINLVEKLHTDVAVKIL